MSFFTSLKLSLKNLWAKKFRTALVSFGSAVAILGLATVLALSAGMDAFSGALEADVTSANPITISTSTYDLDALSGYLDGTLGAMETAEALKNGEIPVSSIAAIVASDGALSVKNKLTERYFRFLSEMPKEYYGAMREKHGMDLSFGLFTDFVSRSGDEERRLSLTAVTSVYEDIISEGGAELGNLLASVAPSPMLLPTGEEYILSQYDLTGKMAKNKDELVLVLGASGTVADVTLALYGYISAEETVRSFTSVASGGEPTVKSISPDELLSKDKTFTFYKNDDIFYKKNDPSGLSPFGYRYDARELGSADSLTLRITGILTPKEHVTYGALPSGLYYTSELEAYARELNKNSEISKHIRATDLGSITSGYSELHGKSVGVFYELAYTHPTKNTSVTATAYMSSRVSDNLLISGLSAGLSEGESLLTLAAIGGSELPTEVQYYPRDFECKKLITDYLDRWNSDEPLKIGNLEYSPEERERVIYTDNSRAILYLINILVDRITSALLIASSLALVVSSVMISVIIYVSVGERTKEIGILRALGAGKRHVAYLFLAEGLTLGALSSVLGVLASFLICGIINSALTGAVGIITMDLATLTLTEVATVLALGVSLALLCAVIPSWLAARKAPVDAIESMA
jgi:putative ABC transport system permease protein